MPAETPKAMAVEGSSAGLSFLGPARSDKLSGLRQAFGADLLTNRKRALGPHLLSKQLFRRCLYSKFNLSTPYCGSETRD